jgi:predicted NAD/FAD-dependent oxidoreductase
MLAAGLEVRFATPVDRIREVDRCYEVAGERYEAVVVSAPIPETEDILASLGDPRRFANARYRPCLSILLGYAADAGDRPYHALLEPEQRHPLTWLSFESIKSPDRAPEGHTALVAQLSPVASLALFDDSDADIVEETSVHVARLLGSEFGQPEATAVVRWRYSQPETTALFDTVNRPGQRVVVASDGVMGGRVEYAYESGVMAARLLLEDPLAR